MSCTKCKSRLTECTCADFEERIAKLRTSPYLVMDWDSILKANREFRQNLKKGPGQ